MRPEDAAAAALAAILPAMTPAAASTRPSAGGPAGHAATAPADQRLRDFFRAHPALGKRDRTQVADWVFDVLRNLRLYREVALRDPVGAGRAGDATLDAGAGELIEVARAAAGQSPGTSCTGRLDRERIAEIASTLPDAVRFSLPDWLWECLRQAHGDRAPAIAQSLLQASPIDLRVNLLRGKADALRQQLAERGIEATPIEGVPTGLRLAGRPNLEKLDLFERGWFEVQDAGSQRIVDVCDVRRGQLVIDFCAGAGGKTLAMAARMRNSGKVLAFDTGEERLSRLMPRARRADVDIVTTLRLSGSGDPRLARYHRRADVVLVDAPCSGTGTLRRSPDIKWRLSPARLALHVQEQQEILAAASALVKRGGRLVYATCSLLREENQQQVDWFTAVAAGTADEWREVSRGEPLEALGEAPAVRRVSTGPAGFGPARVEPWLPDGGGASGFFVAKWLLGGLQTPSPGTIR